jgi:hypothetical protein
MQREWYDNEGPGRLPRGCTSRSRREVNLDAGELTVEFNLHRINGELVHGETKTPGSDAVLPLPEMNPLLYFAGVRPSHGSMIILVKSLTCGGPCDGLLETVGLAVCAGQRGGASAG